MTVYTYQFECTVLLRKILKLAKKQGAKSFFKEGFEFRPDPVRYFFFPYSPDDYLLSLFFFLLSNLPAGEQIRQDPHAVDPFSHEFHFHDYSSFRERLETYKDKI